MLTCIAMLEGLIGKEKGVPVFAPPSGGIGSCLLHVPFWPLPSVARRGVSQLLRSLLELSTGTGSVTVARSSGLVCRAPREAVGAGHGDLGYCHPALNPEVLVTLCEVLWSLSLGFGSDMLPQGCDPRVHIPQHTHARARTCS